MIDFHELVRSAKILIVDDKPANVILLERVLEQAGYADVRSTLDSREVQGLYAEHDFDLILLDIRMPHLDGFEVMEQLTETRHHDDYVPILVLTAQLDLETRLKALGLGARDFVTKPFDFTEVLTRIHNMLEVRILYNMRRREAEILEERVRERTRELQQSRLEIIRYLGRAGEYRDNETGEHVIRMSKSCQRLILAAGADEGMGEKLLHASPMHDVGKIGIPDRVLLKPGKLNDEEWLIMKTHTVIGHNILIDHPSELMRMARTIALTHHEQWNGSGYPQGLKGEEIPLEGRVAAVCDVFDALTSERPYKKAWPVEEAISFINEKSGSHFDPDLVRAFNTVVDEILAIRAMHGDDRQSAAATLGILSEYSRGSVPPPDGAMTEAEAEAAPTKTAESESKST